MFLLISFKKIKLQKQFLKTTKEITGKFKIFHENFTKTLRIN